MRVCKDFVNEIVIVNGFGIWKLVVRHKPRSSTLFNQKRSTKVNNTTNITKFKSKATSMALKIVIQNDDTKSNTNNKNINTKSNTNNKNIKTKVKSNPKTLSLKGILKVTMRILQQS